MIFVHALVYHNFIRISKILWIFPNSSYINIGFYAKISKLMTAESTSVPLLWVNQIAKDLNSLDNIALSFNVVFPLMLLMFVGYELRKFKITDAPSLDVMNRMIFRLFLPVMLFINIYSMDPEETLNSENVKLLGLVFACVLGSAVLGHLIFSRFIKDRRKCSVMIQGIFRSNLVIFGIPIVASIYGEEHLGTVSLLAAFIVPFFNILAVIVLEVYRGGKVHLKVVLLGILKNPLIIAAFAAFLLLLFRLSIPGLLLTPLQSIAKIATPLAFIVLGGTFQFDRLKVNVKYLSIAVIGRLVLMPTIIFSIAVLLGFRNEALVALIAVAASPTAVSSFSMAKEMDADGELAGQIVVITSITCILTIFLWVLLLKTMGLI